MIDESPTIKSFVIVPEQAFEFDTGQFVELTLPGEGEAPLTPSSSPTVHEQMEITIMNAGRVTAQFHACQKGQPVAIRGPYGKGYPIDEFVGKQVYIVGGGVGLAPIRSLFLTLVDRIKDFQSVVCRFGARTPADFIYKDTLFGDWQKLDGVSIKLTVDEANGDWDGNTGVVTNRLTHCRKRSVSGPIPRASPAYKPTAYIITCIMPRPAMPSRRSEVLRSSCRARSCSLANGRCGL